VTHGVSPGAENALRGVMRNRPAKLADPAPLCAFA
jgi:hypothetical protein